LLSDPEDGGYTFPGNAGGLNEVHCVTTKDSLFFFFFSANLYNSIILTRGWKGYKHFTEGNLSLAESITLSDGSVD
jgi:hypothetical protein